LGFLVVFSLFVLLEHSHNHYFYFFSVIVGRRSLRLILFLNIFIKLENKVMPFFFLSIFKLKLKVRFDIWLCNRNSSTIIRSVYKLPRLGSDDLLFQINLKIMIIIRHSQRSESYVMSMCNTLKLIIYFN